MDVECTVEVILIPSIHVWEVATSIFVLELYWIYERAAGTCVDHVDAHITSTRNVRSCGLPQSEMPSVRVSVHGSVTSFQLFFRESKAA